MRSNKVRRQARTDTIPPVRYEGHVTAWRGLASYEDPETGKQRRKSVTRPTRRAVEAALKALIAELPATPSGPRRRREPLAVPPAQDERSVLAFMHRWLNHKVREVRSTSYRSYLQALHHLAPHLRAKGLVELSVADVEAALSALLVEGRTVKTAGFSLHTLRMALRQGVRWGVLDRNVAEQVRRPRGPTAELAVWTPQQAKAFLAVAQAHRLSPLFLLALSSGMRKGELLALRWADVNFERGEVNVPYGLIRDLNGAWVLSPPKTRASRRSISLPPDVVEVLREHQRQERTWAGKLDLERFVVTSSSGAPLDPSSVSKILRMLVRQAGVPRLRFHDLRHTAANLLIRQDIPVKLVGDRLGHTDVAFMARVYGEGNEKFRSPRRAVVVTRAANDANQGACTIRSSSSSGVSGRSYAVSGVA